MKEESLIKRLNLDVPRLIIIAFFIFLCVAAVVAGIPLDSLLSDVLRRIGMNGVLVLAMIPGILCGITLNFGISLGIVGGILSGLLAIEIGLTGFTAFVFACALGIAFSSVIGFFYGQVLNRVKGTEMTISTYAGFSGIALMCIVWLLIPLKNPTIGWSIGSGLRNTIALDSTFGGVLNNFMSFKIGPTFVVPTGLLLFFALCCFLMWLFMRTRTGIAMAAAGNNPNFAKAAGINVDRMRLLGTTISTAMGAVGILVYAQSFGFLQLYNAPMMMPFQAVAAILIGGASIKKAKVSHAILGVFLFQGLLALGLPVANLLAPEGNLSEIIRIIVQNGIILFALTQSGGES